LVIIPIFKNNHIVTTVLLDNKNKNN